jgi:type IV secretion system protein VirB4
MARPLRAALVYVNDIHISIVRNRLRQGAPGILDRLFSLL